MKRGKLYGGQPGREETGVSRWVPYLWFPPLCYWWFLHSYPLFSLGNDWVFIRSCSNSPMVLFLLVLLLVQIGARVDGEWVGVVCWLAIELCPCTYYMPRYKAIAKGQGKGKEGFITVLRAAKPMRSSCSNAVKVKDWEIFNPVKVLGPSSGRFLCCILHQTTRLLQTKDNTLQLPVLKNIL